MLRAAHYKPEAVDLHQPGKSPPRHRAGGILDLALTAADKYALSLLPTALKGTALVAGEAQPPAEYRPAQQHHQSHGGPPPLKVQRGVASTLQPTPSQAPGASVQQPLDSRMTSSWDASLKEILAALEPPDNRTLKPAKLRDHKYPNQNHGMPSNFTIPAPRRELDDALITLPGGTRRNKPVIPSYSAAVKGYSRQSRRPDIQNVDVQYDLVPGVKLAWAGPNTSTSTSYNAGGAYSTTGFGGSPKKYTSQLVGRVSPHYASMPTPQPSTSLLAGSQDPIHLPDISPGHMHSQASAGFRGGSFASPSYQSWTHAAPPVFSSHGTPPRKALPYVSTNAPSLAKPITVQYHPVLKSSSMGATAQPYLLGTSPSASSMVKSTPPRPATDQGAQQNLPFPVAMPTTPSKPYGSPPYRLPHTPPEVAAEVARLRHAQELDGVINGVRSDLQRAASPRNELPLKSKFLQMYEDPNRPLAKLNPKQLLADMMPTQYQQPLPRRQRPPVIATDKRPSAAGAFQSPSTSPSGSSAVGRSPMYERRLKPLPSGSPADDGGKRRESFAAPNASEDEGEAGGLQNVHLTPPEVPGLAPPQAAAAPQPANAAAEAQVGSGRSTPRSLLLEPEDTQAELGEEQEAAVEDRGQGRSLPEGEGLSAASVAEAEAAGEVQAAAAQQAALLDAASQEAAPTELVDAMAVSQEASLGPQAEGQDQQPAAQSMGVSPEAQGQAAIACQDGAMEEGVSPSSEAAAQPAASAGAPEGATEEQQQQLSPAAEAPPPAVEEQSDAGRASASSEAAQAGAEPDQLPLDAPAAAQDGTAESQEAPALAVEQPAAADPEEEQHGAGAAEAPSGANEAGAAETAGPSVAADGTTDAADVATAAAATVDEQPEAATEAAGPAPTADTVPAEPEPEPEAEAGTHPTAVYTLPPGVTPEMAEAAVLCIQTNLRGYQDRRRVAEVRKRRATGEAPHHRPAAYDLPPGVTPEMATEAAIRIQSHARGYLARRHVKELRKGAQAGTEALVSAVTEAEKRRVEGYQLPPGVTPEMAEAAVVCMQSHARGYLARRRVKHLRASQAAAAAAAEQQAGAEQPKAESQEEADTSLREAGEAVSTGAGQEDAAQAAAAAALAAELEAGAAEAEEAETEKPAPAREEGPQELTIDALKAALADDEEDDTAAGERAPELEAVAPPAEPDLSDPAAVAAAAAAAAIKGASRLFASDPADAVADTATAVDQAAVEASMARLAASSARTSAMFQGAGAEMRYSDDEASALELMDNLDGLLQGEDEAAAAAAAVAAAAAPTEGELVSISADGVSEPQALGSSSGAAPANPMDVTEPGGVRVLAGKYEVQHVVGEGAYGMVMKCKVRGTEPVQWVAIKEFKIDDSDPDAEDVKRTSLREVAVLEALQHPHVVGFVDKFMVGDRLFIVMEFLPCNLLELLEAQPGGMDRDAVRLIMFQLCSAIAFIHSKGMVYRDIKPENLLVDEHGTVKLCDFGFARYLPSSPTSHLTDYVATRWYRAPELLLGPPYRDSTGKHIQYMYGPQVDMWAVGCLMGELLDGEPLFAGDSDLDQLYRVQQILGPMAPTHQYLFYANPHNTGIVFNIKQPVTLGARYRGKVTDVELSFMAGLLEMDPEKRFTGEQCLQHPYLVDLAAAANTLPTPSTSMTATEDVSNGGAATDDGTVGVGTSSGGGMDLGVDVSLRDPAPDAPVVAVTSTSGEQSDGGAGQNTSAGTAMSPTPVARGASWRAGADPVEKAGSLTRAAGSLTRGGRSVSRNSMVPPHPALSSSPVSGSGSMRAGVVRTNESGQVVIVEGVEEGEEGEPVAVAVAPVPDVKIPVAVSAGLSEIEPAD